MAHWLRDRGFDAYAVTGGIHALLGAPLPEALEDEGHRQRDWKAGASALRHRRFQIYFGGVLLGVMLRAGKSRLGLSQDDWKKGRDRQKGIGMRIFIATTQKVDEIAARAKQAGIKLDAEPHDSEWNRAFEVTDPSGFKLTITNEPE